MLDKIDFSESTEILEKAVYKYIRRFPNKNPSSGKKWSYVYPKDFKHPMKALLDLFALSGDKITRDYNRNNIKQEYGVSKREYAAHLLEYFSNKKKWDTFFADKEKRVKHKSPRKGGGKPKGKDTSSELPKFNKSLMRKIWSMYNGKKTKKRVAQDTQPAPAKLEKQVIAKADKWLVDNAKEVGLDIDGFEHEITNQFVAHVMKEHGDVEKEKSRGNVAIVQEDFEKLSSVVKNPDMAIVGAKRGDATLVIYAKQMADGTTLYFEEVLTEKESLRSKTMYKKKFSFDKEKVLNVICAFGKTDISGAKIIEGEGRLPSGVNDVDPAAATSARHDDVSNIPQSGEMSSSAPADTNLAESTKPVLSQLETINDIRTLYDWLDSAKAALQGVRAAPLKEIKSQWNYKDGGYGRAWAEWCDVKITEDDIGKYAEPEDIKQAMIFNAQAVVDAIQKKIDEIQFKEQMELTIPVSEAEEHHNRSVAMEGNDNAAKDGMLSQTEAEREAEQKETTAARAKAGLPPTKKYRRTSAMQDSTWDPKSKDYRYRAIGHVPGSRKEIWRIRNMAKNGAQATNKSIDWDSVEENKVVAVDLITKQNLMGKPDWETLQTGGLTGGAGYLINEIYKTINSRPEIASADNRFNFSRGLDSIRSRMEKCKTFDDVLEVVGEIHGEITGVYIASMKTPEYLELAEQKKKLEGKLDKYNGWLKNEIYKAGDPFRRADALIKEVLDIRSGVEKLIDPISGQWDGSVYCKGSTPHKRLRDILEDGKYIYNSRKESIEKANGINSADLQKQIREISDKMSDAKRESNKELRIKNAPEKAAWATFGRSFETALSETICIAESTKKGEIEEWPKKKTITKHFHAAKTMAPDDFSWTEKTSRGGAPQNRKTQFEFLVADNIIRKGGRDVKAESTEAFAKMFNLRAIQLGTWVAEDKKSAMFHVEHAAKGFADIADITGIPDNLISLNGRLAMALGARGRGGKNAFAAHYEPTERVINITKMNGGGSLGHEWWHAFDNLIADAMTGGRYGIYLSEADRADELTPKQKKLFDRVKAEKRYYEQAIKRLDPENDNLRSYKNDYERAKTAAKAAGVNVDAIENGEEHIGQVKAAFSNLVNAMMTGNADKTKSIEYTKEDYDFVNADAWKDWMNAFSRSNMNFDDFMKRYSIYTGRDSWSRSRHNADLYVAGIKKSPEQMRRYIAAHLGKEADGGVMKVKTGEKTSNFFEDAKDLDLTRSSPYWATIRELGARAFSAYLADKMTERGWENNYIAHATGENDYGSHKPYPRGEERKAINAAFDALFRVVNESGAIRKALAVENAWRARGGREKAINEAVNGALRFFDRLRHGYGTFEKKLVRKSSGRMGYEWVAEDDVMEKGSIVIDANNDAHDEGNGRYTENGRAEGTAEKWYRHILTDAELKQFLDDARNGRKPGNALIGMVSDSAKKIVRDLTGINVTKIVVEDSRIVHANDTKHHLRDDDIEKCVDVINNSKGAKLSSKTNTQGLPVIEFKGNVDGVIYFAEAVHKKHEGWLSLTSAYRPYISKVSGVPMLSEDPPELTSEAPRPMPSESPDAATASISHTDESAPAGRRFSTLDDSDILSPQTEKDSTKKADESAIAAAKEQAKTKGNNSGKHSPRILTTDELKQFIEDSIAKKPIQNERATIGKVNDTAQQRISDAYGKSVKIEDIDIDNHSIVHAMTQLHHNLEPDDLLLAVEVMNTATDIELSEPPHQNNDVLVFKKDIDGEITFLVEVHIKNGYFLVCDAWRQRKARSRRRSDAAARLPRSHVQDASPRDELTKLSPQSDRESSGELHKSFYINPDEEEQAKQKFEQAFYDFFKNKDGKIICSHSSDKIRKLDGYPKGLSTENCDFHSIGADCATIVVHGDWQHGVFITLGVKNGKLGIISLFETHQQKENYDSIQRRIEEIESRYGASKEFGKSLTYSGYPLQGRTKVHGMDISIENKKGSVRCGADKDGHEWRCPMHFDYGYIRETVGVDKDHLDAYIGKNPESEIVYIVNQNDPVMGKFDEQKVMLGFNSEAEAKEAYMKQYDRPGFFGSILKMDIDTFKEEAFNKKNKGKPLMRREEMQKSFAFIEDAQSRFRQSA
jgi:hypothetical protein